MSDMPSPVLIIGDTKLGKDTVVKAKRKYKSYYWETVSASKDSCDSIRMSAGFQQFGHDKKVVLITDLPNRKHERAFIVDLVKMSSDTIKFVIWDSGGAIKVDPKKGINKTWTDWINELKENKGFVLVNNGGDFADNDIKNSAAYVQQLFEKKKRSIDNVTAKIFVDIVGKSRAMLSSEVNKLCFTAPQKVTKEFILENAYPSSKEAVLYKFGNDLDTGSYVKSINSLENYMDLGIDANVLAHIICGKAKWHLAICHLWSEGVSWNSIRYEILQMGKFPSCVWHDDQISESEKKKVAVSLNDRENMREFMNRKLGIPKDYLYIPDFKPSKTVRKGDAIPMPFMADMIISYAKRVVDKNKGNYSGNELRERVLDRAVNVYLTCTDNLKEIRYSTKMQKENLYQMVESWTNINL